MPGSVLRVQIRACALVAFYLVSDWLREGHEKWRPIIKHKSKQRKYKVYARPKIVPRE